MNDVGLLVYYQDRDRLIVSDGSGAEVRELHCGDVLDVMPCDDERASRLSVRVECDSSGWWYLVDQYGHERDDFELLSVRL